MYVILIIVVLFIAFIAALLFTLALYRMAVRDVRKRQAMASRLAAAEVRAERVAQARGAEFDASEALTTVLPAIMTEERAPRKVA
jgi:uncharacterized membrane protein